MATKEIIEIFCFDENEVKEALLDAYHSSDEEEDYKDWEIKIDIGKTPAIITIKKHKSQAIL